MTRLAGPFLLVLLIALTPLFVAVIPPIHDYPFHLARMEILASLPHSPFLRAHYEVGSYFLPNVGMDVAMMPLYHLFPIVTAGRVFLGLTLALILSGTVALHAAIHRRVSVWPLLAAFFLYNWIFLFGFLNYILGIGLALWAAAVWMSPTESPDELVQTRAPAGAAAPIAAKTSRLSARSSRTHSCTWATPSTASARSRVAVRSASDDNCAADVIPTALTSPVLATSSWAGSLRRW